MSDDQAAATPSQPLLIACPARRCLNNALDESKHGDEPLLASLSDLDSDSGCSTLNYIAMLLLSLIDI